MSTASSIYSQLERSGSKFVAYRHIRIILSNLTGLFAVTAILMAVMTAISFMLGEGYAAPGFAVSFAVSGLAALALKIAFPVPEELELRHAMLVAALAYLIVPAVSTIPFVMVEQMSVLDAFFEAISGWSCTGLTMITYPEQSTHIIQLFRSVTEWIGGIGVILLMVTILIRPGTSTYIMYQSEARKDKIKPSIRSTINMIWFLYFVLTLLGVALLVIAGMPVWDSINHSMVAIGTGGFSVWSDSIAHYQSIPIEIGTLIVMILGALPFVFIYKSVKNPKSLWALDSEVKAFFIIIVVGVSLLTIENYLQHGQFFASLRISAYQFISGLTTTGLSTTDITGWSHSALVILSIAGIIGGCAGSTSGGLKVSRIVFLIKEFELWMKRTLLPRNAIVTLKIGNKRLAEDLVRKELSEAALISFLYLVSILVSVMILSHLVAPGYDLSTIVFQVCSAQGNVGLQTAICSPAMHWIGKVLFIVNMWIGRLEIIPVTLLIRYMIKGFRI
ncbi:MAG: potassium transporter [Methanocella sp. PtaU1.Bin125]|nr:MAG: potassium transporter [Methanocella sp. PtaU1.Bin125]